MTITTEISSVTYTGNGSTTDFPFTFRVDEDEDLVVTKITVADGTEDELGGGEYTVAGIGNVNGGSVTVTPALSFLYELKIERIVPFLQELNIDNNGGFQPEVIEGALDTLEMQIQQVAASVEGFEEAIETLEDDFDNLEADLASETSARVAADTALGVRIDDINVAGVIGSGIYTPAETAIAESNQTAIDKIRDSYIDARNYGVTTASSNVATALENALNAGVSQNKPVKLPPGTLAYGTSKFINIPDGKNLRMFSDGETVINLTGGSLTIQGTLILTTSMTADVARGATTVTLASVTGITIGSLLFFDTDTNVESGFGYDKQQIRRVTDITGLVVTFDQRLDFFFSMAESTVIKVYGQSECFNDGVSLLCSHLRQVNLKNITGGLWTRGYVKGPARKWSDGANYSDGVTFERCDQMTFSQYNMTNLRYACMMFASRFITIKQATALSVRHIDMNTWAQQCRLEDIVGIDTDGLIQAHPCIDPTFLRVRDGVTGSNTSGLDLRCFGGTVTDCDADGTAVGQNTNAMSGLDAAYAPMGLEYNRRITRFRSSSAYMAAGHEGALFVEDCRVPLITKSVYGAAVNKIYVDEQTVTTRTPSVTDAFLYQVSPPKAVVLTKTSTYRKNGSILNITGVTQANPGVVTSAAHGLSNGQVIYINGCVGMVEINKRFFKLANVATNTFELTDVSTSANINTSGYVAWVSGGKITPQTLTDTVDALSSSALGIAEKMLFKSKVFSETAGSSTSHSGTVKIRAFPPGAVSQSHYTGIVRVRAKSYYGRSVAAYAFNFGLSTGVFNTGTKVNEGADVNSVVASASNFVKHFSGEVQLEGTTFTPSLQPDVNDQYYFTLDWAVSLPLAVQPLHSVEIEVELEKADA